MSGRTFLRFLNSFLHTGTPDATTFLRGDGAWASALSGLIFITPDSITVNSGGTPVGTVSDVQTLLDGNVYQVPEVTGTPPTGAIDIDFNFTGVASIEGFVSMIRYTGSASHVVVQTLYNYSTTNDDEYLLIPNTASTYQYRTVLIPDATNYISSGNAVVSIIHQTTGNASHDIYIDYVALIGTTT